MKGFIQVALLTLLFCPSAHARRSPPKEPAPVTFKGVTYSAPYSRKGWDQVGGYITAQDAKTGKHLWDLMVYRIKYDGRLECDVQNIFITSLKIAAGQLAVKNEKGSRYMIDVQNRKVLSGEPRTYESNKMRNR